MHVRWQPPASLRSRVDAASLQICDSPQIRFGQTCSCGSPLWFVMRLGRSAGSQEPCLPHTLRCASASHIASSTISRILLTPPGKGSTTATFSKRATKCKYLNFRDITIDESRQSPGPLIFGVGRLHHRIDIPLRVSQVFLSASKVGTNEI